MLPGVKVMLEEEGFKVSGAGSSADAVKVMDQGHVDAILQRIQEEG